MSKPRLGHHFEVCIDVNDLKESIAFYEKLGLRIYTGGPDKGWCTMTDDILYLALFPDNFIQKEFGVKVLFNYRGGNMNKIIPFLREEGFELEKDNEKEGGIGDAIIKDINGHKFYFDTSPDEERIDVEE